MKQKFKKFFTLDHRKSDGFTLVELIVVIAILAILGGVSVPAYNMYITRANEAADRQILSAVNSAFASACLENQIEPESIEHAVISIADQRVYGMSTISPAEISLDAIEVSFKRYYEGNENTVFKTENANSLVWNNEERSENVSFIIDKEFADMRIRLADGTIVTVSAEDLKDIQNSTFATMGLSGVTTALSNINKSGELLAGLVASVGAFDRLSAALVANGYMTQAEADKIASDLNPLNLRPNWLGGSQAKRDAYAKAQQTSANGLQMCVAEYLSGASKTQIDDLMKIDLGTNSTTGMVSVMTDKGGTVGSSALAMQYGVAQSFANSSYASNTTIDGKSVSQYLASAEDPVTAINKIKNTDGYKEYAKQDQYQKDVAGLAGTLGVVGDNVKNDNIDTDAYLDSGINSSDAQAVLGAVLK